VLEVFFPVDLFVVCYFRFSNTNANTNANTNTKAHVRGAALRQPTSPFVCGEGVSIFALVLNFYFFFCPSFFLPFGFHFSCVSTCFNLSCVFWFVFFLEEKLVTKRRSKT